MHPCRCHFKSCNGARIKRSTYIYHQQQDLKKGLSTPRVPLPSSDNDPSKMPHNLAEDIEHHLLPCHPTPVPESAPDDRPLVESITHPPPSDFSDSPQRTQDNTDREDAEERGRVYIQRAEEAIRMASEVAARDLDEDGDEADEASPVDPPELASRSLPVPPPSHLVTPTFVDPGDPTTSDENHPDPFYTPLESTEHPASLTLSSTLPPLFLLYLLISWLHTHFHLPFVACNAALSIFLIILQAAGIIFTPDMPIYFTLATILSHLGVEPDFSVLPVCPVCLEVYPVSTAPDSLCTQCSSPLYRTRKSLDRRGPTTTKPHPLLRFPMKSIEQQLRDILMIPGIEEKLEEWRSRPRSTDVMVDIFDGEVCKTIPAPNGQPFFENPLLTHVNELRIGLSLGLDWCGNSTFSSANPH